MVDDREVQAVIVERLRALAARAGGWERADPYVLHYLIAHADQAADGGEDLTGTAVADLLDDPQFVARAEAARLARAVVRRRGRVDGPTARLLERSIHEFAHLRPADRLGLLGLVALQEGLSAPPSSPAPPGRWRGAWASWRASAAHVTLTGHEDWVRAVAFSPDGAALASAGHDGTVKLWDAATGEARSTIPLRSPVSALNWYGGLVAIGAQAGLTVVRVD